MSKLVLPLDVTEQAIVLLYADISACVGYVEPEQYDKIFERISRRVHELVELIELQHEQELADANEIDNSP